MSKRRESPHPAQLTPDRIRNGLVKLDRRIVEFKEFDVETIGERFDPTVSALRQKVNDTIALIFGHGTIEYNSHLISSLDTLPLISGEPPKPVSVVREAYRKGIDNAVIRLTSLRETLQEQLDDSDDQTPTPEPPSHAAKRAPGNRRVFIVHGQDDVAKQQVKEFLGQLDLKAIILHEQANQGKTIIEKLESHAEVDFAVVLLTPDDTGYPKDKSDEARDRARQNVVLELGLFVGTLGRKHVCPLYKEGVEMPSDYDGVGYVQIDSADGWKLSLARELKAAGIDIDMNKAV